MNNKYFASLLCITVLALAPACKRQEKAVAKEDVNTMIEVEASVVETEETMYTKKSINKF